jgi:hypothetical protein
MATPLKIETNQRNAQNSTGPASPSGTQRAAMNSVKHGFTGQTLLLPAEEAEAYRLFTEKFLAEMAPQGVHEEHLVHTIMTNRWRLTQIAATEAAIYVLGHRENAGQFEDETPEMALAISRAITFEQKRRELDRLRRYENALFRHVTKDTQQLAELQTARKASEAQQETDAIALLTHFTAAGKPWNPADFGFVLSIPEIQALEDRQFLRNRVCGTKN